MTLLWWSVWWSFGGGVTPTPTGPDLICIDDETFAVPGMFYQSILQPSLSVEDADLPHILFEKVHKC